MLVFFISFVSCAKCERRNGRVATTDMIGQFCDWQEALDWPSPILHIVMVAHSHSNVILSPSLAVKALRGGVQFLIVEYIQYCLSTSSLPLEVKQQTILGPAWIIHYIVSRSVHCCVGDGVFFNHTLQCVSKCILLQWCFLIIQYIVSRGVHYCQVSEQGRAVLRSREEVSSRSSSFYISLGCFSLEK